MNDPQPLPTDAEIIALADETRTGEPGRDGYILPISFARAALAKWGQPQAVAGGEPVDRVFIVATGEEHEGEATYTRYDHAPPPLCDSECLYAAPPPAVVEPLLVQHHRDSKELRKLCAERDQARRERDVHKAEIAGLEASCSTLGKLVDELRADGERLEWVLRRCHGTWLRAHLGLVSDTGDMETLRTLIDANRGALSSAHDIAKGGQHGADT